MKKIFLTTLLSIALIQGFAQNKNYKVICVGFYNFENLFDTINDPLKNDEDFLPEGNYHYNSKVYYDKLSKLSDVVSQIGTEMTPDGVAILGTAEIENITVLKDFVKQPKIAARNYQIIHHNSPDDRGIDVALLYNPKYLKVIQSKALHVDLPSDGGTDKRNTRDVLWVYGIMDQEPVHIFVNHWPSRRGGEEASAPGRAAAAQVDRMIIDSLLKENPDCKIFVMGDLNDDPVNKSVTQVLRAKGSIKDMKENDLYNPWADFYKKGYGTLAWNDAWNLFDQIVISKGLLNKESGTYFYYQSNIFKREFMMNPTGANKGYPYRTYNGSNYIGGYSDHFPVYMFLLKEQ